MTVYGLLDSTVGDVLFFNYEKEDKSARNRLARVTSHGGYYINAIDLENGGPRNFNASRATNVEKVATADQEVKPLDEVIKELFKVPVSLPGEDVARIYRLTNDVKNVSYFDKAEALVITHKEVEPSIEVETNQDGYAITFKNSKGKNLALKFNEPSGLLTICKDGIVSLTNPKPQDFVKSLSEHYS